MVTNHQFISLQRVLPKPLTIIASNHNYLGYILSLIITKLSNVHSKLNWCRSYNSKTM